MADLLDDLRKAAGFGSTQKASTIDTYVNELQKVKITIGGSELELVGGAFRDLPFFVDEHEFASGRRVLSHEMPLVDEPQNEDIGRKTRTVSFSAYLVGELVFQQRDALLEACEKFGPGTLVHPYFGKFQARCLDIKIKESKSEKRYASISLSFVLDPQTITPKVQDDLAQQLRDAADAADAANAENFNDEFTIIDAANFVIDSALGATNTALDYVFEAKASVRSVAAFVDKFTRLKANAEILLASPESLAKQIQDLINFVDPDADASSTAITNINEALEISNFRLPDSPGGATPQRSQEVSNLNQIQDIVAQTAAANSGRSTADATFESVQQAQEYIKLLDTQFDNLQEVAASDTAFEQSQAVQSDTLNYIIQTSGDLARAVNYTPRRTVPSIVLAYELSGEITTSEDIIKRNKIVDPNFIPGGISLEILQGGSNGS